MLVKTPRECFSNRQQAAGEHEKRHGKTHGKLEPEGIGIFAGVGSWFISLTHFTRDLNAACEPLSSALDAICAKAVARPAIETILLSRAEAARWPPRYLVSGVLLGLE